MGDIVLKLPLPPSCLPTLWNNDERYVSGYLSRHPGYYLTGDAGYKDEDDYLWIMSRTDDVINVAGHRLSTGQMEEVLAGHPDVADCAVIGIADALKGQLPLGLVVLKAGSRQDPGEIARELVALMREKIGPVAAFKKAMITQTARRNEKLEALIWAHNYLGNCYDLLGERAILKPDLSRNMITIKASPAQVEESVQMLRALDTPTATRTYELRTMPVAKASELLGRITSSQTTIVEDPVGHRLLVSGSDFELNRIDGLVGLLDSGRGLGSAVVPVK